MGMSKSSVDKLIALFSGISVFVSERSGYGADRTTHYCHRQRTTDAEPASGL